ncbi:MAG: helix-hairpin-helix domain-containing protein [Meiothermus sp.]|uniref:ComEA family DNA-binding protein n=1 Tax=Meiothermus sp. TaxID=1955249 RepID=UPI0025F362DC|nr:helix-hairpin-helix domain-containing protein [Meiothermus sp.]MCS7058559.1 helix-hairpin-helix domain-containing protein [Meiothermus sp.]MCS7194140.1 helix-hairpin-helix domain-containing protein [Meiothermus sp.]MCX7739536.1 helix-hairpin-helix domain-containing protein [Meiothermus sp.]MDW8091794.1 helix-hairpin-helix domain-containing protein [Meiothermus sp.]MDW8481549.1 helix-hairpin-helix domain-containing protein [Meiothermus sp.]
MKAFKQSLIALLALVALAGGALANPAPTPSAHPTAQKSTQKIAPVNVNTATLAQLETLPGVGPKLAAQIIQHRPYKNAQELRAKVKGIGPKLWASIKPYVRF